MRNGCVYFKFALVCIVTIIVSITAQAEGNNATQPVYDLIKRVLPQHAQSFEVAFISQDQGKDVFEIESADPSAVSHRQ